MLTTSATPSATRSPPPAPPKLDVEVRPRERERERGGREGEKKAENLTEMFRVHFKNLMTKIILCSNRHFCVVADQIENIFFLTWFIILWFVSLSSSSSQPLDPLLPLS